MGVHHHLMYQPMNTLIQSHLLPQAKVQPGPSHQPHCFEGDRRVGPIVSHAQKGLNFSLLHPLLQVLGGKKAPNRDRMLVILPQMRWDRPSPRLVRVGGMDAGRLCWAIF